MSRRVFPLFMASFTIGCVETKPGELNAVEELEVMAAVMDAQRTEAFAGEVVDITTGFTIGAAYERSAENLRDWVASQLPCSEVTVEDSEEGLAVVQLDLGGLDDACTYRGRTYAGALSVTLVSVDLAGEVVLQHDWMGVTNGDQTLTGRATVAWDAEAGPLERRLEYDAVWEDALGPVDALGSLVHTPYSGDRFTEGFVAHGSRDWTAQDGREWALQADEVAARWIDPVPESGQYVVFHPIGKEAVLSFARQDDDTVRVTLSGGHEDRMLDVTRAGVVLPVDE